MENFDKIKKLAGHENLSKLIRQLLMEWAKRQEHLISENPIGLRYETPDSKHWIDSITELQIGKLAEDIELIENQEILNKLKTAAFTINKNIDNQSMKLWRITKGIVKA